MAAGVAKMSLDCEMVGTQIMQDLKAFPSHFTMDGIESLSMSRMSYMIAMINEDKSSDFDDKPWYHVVSRDRNLLLFLEYKVSNAKDAYSVTNKIQQTTKDYPKDMLALANLAWIYVESNDTDGAESCLKRLKSLPVWSRVFADAELAYTYSRMGARFYPKGIEMYEKVLNHRQYPGIEDERIPVFIKSLVPVWSYGAALAYQWFLHQNISTGYNKEFNRDVDGDPERILRRIWGLINKIISFRRVVNYRYVPMAWIVLRNAYMDYRKVKPRGFRNINLKELTGYSLNDCLAKAVRAVNKYVSCVDGHALFMIGVAYRKWPNKDIKLADKYLLNACTVLTKPRFFHQLGLVCVDKWLLQLRGLPYCGDWKNIRDPGNPKLKEAIGYFKKAVELSHQTGVRFMTDLARYKFSFAPDPFTEDSKSEILSIMNRAIIAMRKNGEATVWDQAYAYYQLGSFHEAFGDLKKTRYFLKLSVQKGVSGGFHTCMIDGLWKLMEIIQKNREDNPGVATYREETELYEMIHKYQEAIACYGQVHEVVGDDRLVLEKLAENFCQVLQYMDARQCLKSLFSAHCFESFSQEKKSWFIDVCLKAGRQLAELQERVAAADIYQELITDMTPSVPPAFHKVVVLSSEHPDDNQKTESLVEFLRCDLGFNGDCVWPYESHNKSEGRYYDFLLSYIKRSWCCVVHLTDVLLQDKLFMKFLRNCSSHLIQRRFNSPLVIIDDLTRPAEDQDQLEAYHPMLKYGDLFGCGVDSTTACEQVIKVLLGETA